MTRDSNGWNYLIAVALAIAAAGESHQIDALIPTAYEPQIHALLRLVGLIGVGVGAKMGNSPLPHSDDQNRIK